MREFGDLGGPLPDGIRSRFVHGLRVHMLEAGFGGRDRPRVVLLHGFPVCDIRVPLTPEHTVLSSVSESRPK